MDRRREPERTGGSAGGSYPKALAVITRAYRGEMSGPLYADATDCFDALIDISQGGDSARDFAHSSQTDLKYLVDGANFVISKMHFNPENNHYVTLGMHRSASPEQVRERWKKLMLLYHPDRQTKEAGEEWVTERAKTVNEAYSVLKDAAKRSAYDRRLLDAMASVPFSVNDALAKGRPVSLSTGTSERHSAGNARFRKYLPLTLVAFCVAAVAIYIGVGDFRGDSSYLESELQPDKKSDGGQTASPSPSLPKERKKTAEDQAPLLSHMQEAPGKNAVKRKTTPENNENAVPPPSREKAGPKRHAQDLASAAKIEKKVDTLPESAPPTLLPDRNPHTAARQVTAAKPEEIRKVAQDAGGADPQARRPKIEKAEVEDFIRRYSQAYQRGDLDNFMKFFSRSAIENGVMNYEMIRNSYRKTFAEKISAYRLHDVAIRINGQGAFVSGKYRITRKVPGNDRWKDYGGEISWQLVREDDTLKIKGADYDY